MNQQAFCIRFMPQDPANFDVSPEISASVTVLSKRNKRRKASTTNTRSHSATRETPHFSGPITGPPLALTSLSSPLSGVTLSLSHNSHTTGNFGGPSATTRPSSASPLSSSSHSHSHLDGAASSTDTSDTDNGDRDSAKRQKTTSTTSALNLNTISTSSMTHTDRVTMAAISSYGGGVHTSVQGVVSWSVLSFSLYLLSGSGCSLPNFSCWV